MRKDGEESYAFPPQRIVSPSQSLSTMRTEEVLKLPQRTRLNGASFNEEGDCFVIAYDRGFKVCNADPMETWVTREFSEGGLAAAAMLHRTNYLALVGGGDRPRYPQNKVIIWDDHKNKAALTLEFVLPVLNVLLSRQFVVAVLANRVHVYSFATPPKLLASYDTASNPHGVACMHGNRVAFPGLVEGRVQVVTVEEAAGNLQCRVASVLRAHKAPIRALTMNERFMASASDTGTLIRIHDLDTSALIREVRRGLDKATIWSLALSKADQLAVLSDKATLHVFELRSHGNVENRRHALSGLPLAPKYFRDEWSFVSSQTDCTGPGILGWTSEDTLVVLWEPTARWEKWVVLQSSRELVREAKRSLL